MNPKPPKLKKVAALVVATLLLPSCEQEPPPKPPSLVESANPLPKGAADVRLNAAEPVVAAQAPGTAATQTPASGSPVVVPDGQAKPSPTSQAPDQLPVQASPEPASTLAAGVGMGADLQALREAMARQAEASKSQAEQLQSALAALGQRLSQLESRLASLPQASGKPAQDTKAAHKPNLPHKRKNLVKSKSPRHSMPTAATAKPKQVSALPHHSAGGTAQLPFAVASVDTWDGEQQAMVRVGRQWVGLKAGDTRDGWRIESMDGQAVTVRSPQGDIRHIEAGQGE